MTGTRPLPLPTQTIRSNGRVAPTLARSHGSTVDGSDRQILMAQASDLQERARLRAEAGDIAASAQMILQALDCERRSGGLGPQVLQLIKPR